MNCHGNIIWTSLPRGWKTVFQCHVHFHIRTQFYRKKIRTFPETNENKIKSLYLFTFLLKTLNVIRCLQGYWFSKSLLLNYSATSFFTFMLLMLMISPQQVKTNQMIHWFYRHVNPTRAILCLEVSESHSLYIHIYIFALFVKSCFFTHSPVT